MNEKQFTKDNCMKNLKFLALTMLLSSSMAMHGLAKPLPATAQDAADFVEMYIVTPLRNMSENPNPEQIQDLVASLKNAGLTIKKLYPDIAAQLTPEAQLMLEGSKIHHGGAYRINDWRAR